MKHEAPVLCSAWKDDGTTVFTGACDNKAKMWNLAGGGQEQQVAQHDAPIKACKWVKEMNMLVTGSWDKTLRYAHSPRTTEARRQSPRLVICPVTPFKRPPLKLLVVVHVVIFVETIPGGPLPAP